ncbi:NAD(P)/FAD-dependent oxidoreductase [Amycolatopsis sp. FBCC-B4732]|uniref:type III sulfide quinone reductase, selenoprotein subtype n=1 Tax=Amycolatopsis sp. FBCC-B4732 TaxID=3079339 RepID=UPI001FF66CB0|nr:FAD/NAD(P)-binding oxidoreductase [Amycolatopsis sp. FBCC-B4732]UOX90668.1 NAD(P)/FAD-dependent oxidoreductase [Amycolatopsis sp. FBCC-B4732]
MKRIVILGGGTGGTLAANRLHRAYGDGARIVVVDRDDDHVYQPGLLFVPFGMADADDLVRSRPRQLADGIGYHRGEVERVDLEADRVHLADGTELGYDALVIATGARLMPEETEGLTGPGCRGHVDTFYDLDGAVGLASALAAFDGGKLVVNVIDLPVKCPVAPLEFCFLADWFFTERGIRDRVELTYVTPLDAAFTKPVAARTLEGILEAKGVELVTEFTTGEVDGADGRLVSFDGREVAFDQAVVVPLHGGASYVDRSPGLGDELGFVRADEHTLRSQVKDNIFVLGDAASVPTSKAGSVTHFEGEVLARNVGQFLDGRPLDASFDGHTNCFIESGFGKALLIDFNYDTEPLPGHYPADAGLPLLKESRLNHLGKLMFSWLYWHSLLPGRDLPGVSSAMPRAGKRFPEAARR